MRLNAAQTDRACGVLLAAACGDALGAGYEFGVAPLPPRGQAPEMIGGGLGDFAPGEWTDDTSMGIAIAEVAATGPDLRTSPALDAIAQRFADWYAEGPPDVGIQTGQVLSRAGRHPTAAQMTAVASDVHREVGRSGGNGSLMRTGPVALAHLDDPAALIEAAMSVSALTHHDPQAGKACALWCLAIRHAVIEGDFEGIREAIGFLPEGSQSFWSQRVDEAHQEETGRFQPNGWVVIALQAAWSAIAHTPSTSAGEDAQRSHLPTALETAIRIGDDTDTVASIAGALLGARWGAAAIPAEWKNILYGWPGRRAADLVDMALLTVSGGHRGSND